MNSIEFRLQRKPAVIRTDDNGREVRLWGVTLVQPRDHGSTASVRTRETFFSAAVSAASGVTIVARGTASRVLPLRRGDAGHPVP